MASNNARTWSITLIGVCFFSLTLGLSLGYALFGSGSLTGNQTADSKDGAAEGTLALSNTDAAASDSADTSPAPDPEPSGEGTAEEPLKDPAGAPSTGVEAEHPPIHAARHLIVAVNGQWLAEGTRELLAEIRPRRHHAAQCKSQEQVSDSIPGSGNQRSGRYGR